MGEPAYETIGYELTHDDRVGEILLDRPEKMNALSGQLLAELADALDRIEGHERVKLLVLRGNGGAFSAGYDLTPSEDGAHETPYDEFRREEVNYDRMKRIWDFPMPTIGVVDGYALAGGFELSQMVDLVVATTDAEFGYPIVRGTGTPPVFFLPFVVDNRTARELLFTGRYVSGTEAVDIGLANRVVDPDELDGAVEDLVEEVLHVPSDLLYLNKRMMNRALDIMGYSSVVEQGHDLHITGHGTPSVGEFSRRVEEDGLADALVWRDTTLKD